MQTVNRHPFRKELEKLVNHHSLENGSDTPDFLLAEFLTDCLTIFDRTVAAREKWYGREQVAVSVIDAPKECESPFCDSCGVRMARCDAADAFFCTLCGKRTDHSKQAPPPPPEFEREGMQIARQDDPVHHWLMDHGFLKNEDARRGAGELREIVRQEFQERIDAAEAAASMLRASRDAAVEQEQTSRTEANRLRAELSAMMDLKSTLQDYLIAVEKAIGWKDDEEHNFRALPDWIRHRLDTNAATIASLRAQVKSLENELKLRIANLSAAQAACAEMQRIGAMLVAVARAAWELADNTEEGVVVGEHPTCTIDYEDFDRLSKALDVLDALLEPPGECSTGPRKAEYRFTAPDCGKDFLALVKVLVGVLSRLYERGNNPGRVHLVTHDFEEIEQALARAKELGIQTA